jgi:AraC family transcriptional regulator, transcriptional activator of pobA
VIQNRIVLEAKRLLNFTDLTIGQISDKLGFEDAAYFARYFRKVTNFSPTDFKEKLSEKYR